MQTVLLDRLGVRVSRLGFGNMRLPKNQDGTINRQEAAALIHRAYESGVNYFDTAWPYHNGESEPFTGEALSRYPRDSYFLADKSPLWLINTKEEALNIFNQQLERCGVEYFDFYLLHSLTAKRWKLVLETGVLDLMEDLKRQGKIRFLGFSFHDVPEVFNEIVDYRDWDFAQIQINYIDDVLMRAGELYRKLEETGIPCIVMEPVKGGSLAALPPKAEEIFKGCTDPEAAKWPDPAQWAFRWCAGKDNAKVILSGMSTMEQVEQNLALFSTAPPLSTAELEAVEKVRDYFLSVKTIPCTACGYCDICPKQVSIPAIFEIYNRFKLYQNQFRAKTDYAALTRSHSARACVNCGKCLPICPQNIQIPEQLQMVHELVSSLEVPLQSDSPEI